MERLRRQKALIFKELMYQRKYYNNYCDDMEK